MAQHAPPPLLPPTCRTILVDDTPLAFLHQPENGVPVLGFRGDPDDRLLMEAVLPLVQVRGHCRRVIVTPWRIWA